MSSSSINNCFLGLPKEIWFKCLSYLTPEELARCPLISKDFKRLSNDSNLWKTFFKEAEIKINCENPKIIFAQIGLSSIEKLYKKIDEFISQITLNIQAEFICYFLNPQCLLSINAINEKAFGKGLTLEKNYIFIKKLPFSPGMDEPATKKRKLLDEDSSSLKSNSKNSNDEIKKPLHWIISGLKNGTLTMRMKEIYMEQNKYKVQEILPNDTDNSFVDTVCEKLEIKIRSLTQI